MCKPPLIPTDAGVIYLNALSGIARQLEASCL